MTAPLRWRSSTSEFRVVLESPKLSNHSSLHSLMELYRKAARSLLTHHGPGHALSEGQVLELDKSANIELHDVLKQADIEEPLNPHSNVLDNHATLPIAKILTSSHSRPCPTF